MKTIVYADVLFLINFIINIIILKITSVFSKTKPGVLRLIIASSIGALYALFMFFPDIEFLYIFPVKLLVSVVMIRIITPKCNVVKLCKLCAVFYLTSFAFAGILLALVYFSDYSSSASPILKNGIFYYDISLDTLILTSVIAYVLIRIASAVFVRNKMIGIKNIKVFLDSKECSLNALCDTGNLLKDPLTDRPVVIAERESVEGLFPNGIPDLETYENLSGKFRVIPYHSIGTSSAIMTGFVPDRIVVEGKETEDVVIGISKTSLSQNNEYNALFNPNIIIGGRS